MSAATSRGSTALHVRGSGIGASLQLPDLQAGVALVARRKQLWLVQQTWRSLGGRLMLGSNAAVKLLARPYGAESVFFALGSQGGGLLRKRSKVELSCGLHGDCVT